MYLVGKKIPEKNSGKQADENLPVECDFFHGISVDWPRRYKFSFFQIPARFFLYANKIKKAGLTNLILP